jgi:hypothetical protein
MIEKMIKNISSISEELQLIRKTLEGNGKIMLRVGISGEPDGKKSVKKILPDPEAFPKSSVFKPTYLSISYCFS